jgi:hypothetical protein
LKAGRIAKLVDGPVDHCCRSTGFQHLLTGVNSISSANQKFFEEIFWKQDESDSLSIGRLITAANQLVFSIF